MTHKNRVVMVVMVVMAVAMVRKSLCHPDPSVITARVEVFLGLLGGWRTTTMTTTMKKMMDVYLRTVLWLDSRVLSRGSE